MVFSGAILERGFWVYVWRVTGNRREVLYVGRTGDSSSLNAASPFSRVGQHLDSKPNAKANALYRHLRRHGIDPLRARFEMVAVGPIAGEQRALKLHRQCRDRVGALERAMGMWLQDRGYIVCSVDRTKAPLDELFRRVIRLLRRHFPCSSARPPSSSLSAMAYRTRARSG